MSVSLFQLKEIAESVDYGVTASASNKPIGPKFLRITDIQNGHVNWSEVPWCKCDTKETKSAKLQSGDIVFARTGATTGKSYLITNCPENTVFASYLIRVRLSQTADPSYVSHFFQTAFYWSQINKSARGAAQPGVNATKLKSLQIPIPPLEEQKRIASILDAADALRAKRRESLAKLDDLLQSTFLDMFGDPVTNPKGWEVSELGEICLEKPAYGSGEAACEYNPSMPRYIRITDVDETGELSKERKSAMMDEKEIEKYRLSEGDLLLARSGATVGKSYLHRARNGLCVYAGYMIRFRPDPTKLLPETLFRFTQTKAYWRWIESQARAVAQPNINAKMYSSMPVLLAPLDLQQRFAKIVSSVEEQKAKMRKHLEQLDGLFASLQQRAFRGDL